MNKFTGILSLLVAFVLVGVICLGVLSACSSEKDNNGNTTAAQATASETSTTTEAAKINITFEVIGNDGESTVFVINTDAENLADALLAEGLLDESERSSGLYTEVNGIKADYSADGAWWCMSKNGEMLSVGINDQPIAEGEHYEATYKIGY